MTDTHNLITDNIDLWTSAIKKRNSQGRGSNSKVELVGVKKLRELILELAVRGKLVPQDSNDEPASVLLEKIAEEKEQLIADKKVKRTKPLPVVTDEEKLFVLPLSWEWCRFGNLAQHNSGKTLDKGRNSGKPKPYLTTSNLYWGKFKLDNVKEMLIEDDQLDKCTAVFGDLLICEGGEAGRAAVWQEKTDVCFQNHIHRARFYSSVNPFFMYRFFEYLTATGVIDNYRKGVGISNMSGKSLASIITVLPPLSEQHRIVAKVDELMTLCDQLEQQTEQSLTAHQTLVEELLNTLTQSINADDLTAMDGGNEGIAGANSFQASWQRIADHFDVLFTTETSIDQLKQTILQLAVMGKLVPQNPSDEPASKLLEKIAEEKAQLIKDKKIKKQKPLPAITDEDKPFEIPIGWEWCKLESTALTSEAGWSPSCLPTPRENNKWGVLKVSAVSWGVYNPDENKELPSGLEPRPKCEVHSGDFLISRANTAELVARAVIVPVDAPKKLMMSDKIIRFSLSPLVEGSYISLVNNSRFSRTYYSEVAGGTSSSMKNVSREQIRSLVVALPSQAEQQRIVTKVDELMALCDQLKARLADAQVTQLHLADAVVENALN